MLTIRSLLRPSRIVDAHCDVPCGIYDPEQAKLRVAITASPALTCELLRMVNALLETK